MTTRELNKLLDLVIKLREDLCARYTLSDGPGNCCYNDGSHPTEYCPMQSGYMYCMCGDFEDYLRSMLEKEDK